MTAATLAAAFFARVSDLIDAANAAGTQAEADRLNDLADRYRRAARWLRRRSPMVSLPVGAGEFDLVIA